MKQFELWWAHLSAAIGRRPVLLLSRTPAYTYLSKVIVAEITSTIREIPQEVKVGRAEGLSHASVANMDNVHVVPKTALQSKIGAIHPDGERDVKRALGYALNWPELKVL